MPLQNISFPYCRAKAFSRRPAMLHCNNSAVLLATALLYRLCQTAPIKPHSRFCRNRLVNAVCALPYARHARFLALTRLPQLPDQTALDLCNCYPVDVFYNYDQEYIKTRLTCTDSALVRWMFVSVPTASAPHSINFLCEPACAFAIFEVAKGTALFERSLVVFIAEY